MIKTLALILLTLTLPAQNDGGLKHVYTSAAITMGAAYGVNKIKPLRNRTFICSLIGASLATGVGLGKEYIYDRKLGRGTFSKMDIENNLRGVVLGMFSINIIFDIKKKNHKITQP
jgi:hypothetical protein